MSRRLELVDWTSKAMDTLVTTLITLIAITKSITQWQLKAHGSDQNAVTTKNTNWTIQSPKSSYFNLLYFDYNNIDKPKNMHQSAYGGMIQHPITGNLYIQLLGDKLTNINNSSYYPFDGVNKTYGPPYIWIIDANNGTTIGLYNLSNYGITFFNSLRFTPNGYPIVAVCDQYQTVTILVLNNTISAIDDPAIFSTKIANSTWSNPYFMDITNTEPIQLLTSSMKIDGAFNFDTNGYTFNTKEILNTNTNGNMFIFSTGDKMIYDISKQDGNIWKMKLPLNKTNIETKIIQNCYTLGWLFGNGKNGDIYAGCIDPQNISKGVINITSFNDLGEQIWTINNLWNQRIGLNIINPQWIIIDDLETTLIAGNNENWIGHSLRNGYI